MGEGKLRVAIVSGEFDPERDGVSDYTARLAAHLGRQDAEAFVISTHERARPVSNGEATPHGRPRWAAGRNHATAWDLGEVRTVARALRRLDLDVVHVQFAPSAYGYRAAIGALPLLLNGGPPTQRPRLVVTLHEYGSWAWRPRWAPWAPGMLARVEGRGWWDRETLLLTTRSDRIVVTNPTHAGVVFERFPALAERVIEIPMGPSVEVSPISRADARARLGLAPDVPVLVFSGLVHPTTGILYLLDAAVRLRTSFPDLRLYLVGGIEGTHEGGAADYEQEVQSLISGRALGQTVRVTGRLPEAEVSKLLAAADVAVFPFTAGVTVKSGGMLAALEHRVPVVATAAEPPDPHLEHERHLLLVPRRDSGALAVAITRLLTDRDLGARLAEEGGRLARRHGWSWIARAHMDLYRGLSARRTAVPSTGNRE